MLKIIMIVLATASLAWAPLSCSKKDGPSKEATTKEEPKEASKEASKEESHEGHKHQEAHQEEPKDSAEQKEDDKKVTNVKEAFQYTGKEMDKGFKKTGSSIKKAFVGDGKKD